jgi:hypothetical protein
MPTKSKQTTPVVKVKSYPKVVAEFEDYYVMETVNPEKYQFLIDKEDLTIATEYSWIKSLEGYIVGPSESNKDHKRSHIMRFHRMIIDAPPKKVVDHINGDKLDNRKKNLRICTHIENCRNAKPHKNKYTKGISYRKERAIKIWRVMIRINRKLIHLGHYECLIEAQRVYNEAATKYFKEFACLVDLKFLEDNLDMVIESLKSPIPRNLID